MYLSANILMDLCKRLLITNNDKEDTLTSQINLAKQLLATEENDYRSASESKLEKILIDFIEDKGIDKEREK